MFFLIAALARFQKQIQHISNFEKNNLHNFGTEKRQTANKLNHRRKIFLHYLAHKLLTSQSIAEIPQRNPELLLLTLTGNSPNIRQFRTTI
jgi:hypothetical protein